MKISLLIIFTITLLIIGGLATYLFFNQNPLESKCDQTKINIYKTKDGKEYVSCEIIVGFQDDITLEQAQFILKSENLSLNSKTLPVTEKLFPASHVLTAITPKGKEEYYANKLRLLPQVKYSSLNGIAYVDK